MMTHVPYFVIAAALGGTVGAVELFQRYKAEPLKVLTNIWGMGYVAFNASISVLAFTLWFASKIGEPSMPTPLTQVQWAAICGLGAAAFLRTKLMSIQGADNKDLALGPEILIQTFLKVIDRELDRKRAKVRFGAVRKLMKDIDFEKAKIRLPIQIFQAMQGVSEEESEMLMERIEEVDKMDQLDSQDKSYLLGFYLLDLVGEAFLTDLFKTYGEEFSHDMALGPDEKHSDNSY